MGDAEGTSQYHRRPPLPLDFLDQRRIVIDGSVEPGRYPACSPPLRAEIIFS